MRCYQCSNNAMVNYGGAPLCLNCYNTLHRIQQDRDRMLKEQMNWLLDQADAMTGISAGLPRYDLSPPVHMTVQAPQRTTMNHIVIKDGAIVGSINTGEIQKLDVTLSHINANGGKQLSDALAAFSQAVIDSAELAAATKNDIIEQISALSTEATKPHGSRKIGVMKALIQNIQAVVGGAASLVTSWHTLHPLLLEAFKQLQAAKL